MEPIRFDSKPLCSGRIPRRAAVGCWLHLQQDPFGVQFRDLIIRKSEHLVQNRFVILAQERRFEISFVLPVREAYRHRRHVELAEPRVLLRAE